MNNFEFMVQLQIDYIFHSLEKRPPCVPGQCQCQTVS